MSTKVLLANRGKVLVENFCRLNSKVVELPAITFLEPEDREYHLNSCGFYRPHCGIKLMIPKCAALGSSGPAWSWPGHIIDRTPYGVLAHELGHHCHYQAYAWSTHIQDTTQEPKLTNYCPNPGEWFAEIFRLFVTNPDLLSLIRPKTFALLSEDFKPVETRPWNKVLSGAPARTIAIVHRRIKEVQKTLE